MEIKPSVEISSKPLNKSIDETPSSSYSNEDLFIGSKLGMRDRSAFEEIDSEVVYVDNLFQVASGPKTCYESD